MKIIINICSVSFFLLNFCQTKAQLVEYGFDICEPIDLDIDSMPQVNLLYKTVDKNYKGMELACIYHQLGIAYFKNQEPNKAIACYEKSKQLREKFDDGMLWKSHFGLGLVYRKEANYNKSIKNLKKAHSLKGNKPSRHLANIRKCLCEDYAEKGEYGKAIQFCEVALSIKGIEKSVRADILDVLSGVLADTKKTENLKRAIKVANKSIKLNDSIGKFLATAKPLNNLGRAFLYQKKYVLAIKSFEKALEVLGNTNDLFQAKLFNNIASALKDQGKYEESNSYLFKALALKKEITKGKTYHPEYYPQYYNIAENFQKLHKFNDALSNIQTALINISNHFKDDNILRNPDESDFLLYIILGLNLKAHISYDMYRKDGKITYLNLSEQTYIKAQQFYMRLLQNMDSETSRLIQAGNLMPSLETAMNVSYELYKKHPSFEETAFQFMELNKATVLLQSIYESDALKFANIPDSLLQIEITLKDTISFCKKQLSKDIKGGDTHHSYNKLLFNKEIEYNRLIEHFENSYPNYYDLKYKHGTIKLNHIQQQLDDSSAILEYFVGNNLIFLMTIQKDQVEFYQLDKPIDWDSRIDSIQSFISTDIYIPYKNKDIEFVKDAYYIYQILLEKPLACLNDKVKKLQIIPDDKLNYIPFEILLTEPWKKDSIKYDKLPYLRNEKIISYAYSTELLLKSKNERNSSAITNYSIYAGNYSESKYQEVSCDLLTSAIPDLLNGQTFKDDDCSIANFIGTANQNKVVNFFLHGDTGTLIFTPRKDSIEYLLKINDLYNIELDNVEMAILTACLTGFGPNQKGEGVMSISRAFTYAGCSSLIMSLWSVPSKPTCEIIYNFIKKLILGKPKDEALHAGKTAYLEQCVTDDSTSKCHPFYWTGFVSTGNMSPIQFNK